MNRVIPHTIPSFDNREAAALAEILAGKMVNEGELAAYLAAKTAQMAGGLGGVPTSTGTLGLHLALKTLGISESQDEVIIPDFACRCLYDCVKMAGGTPVFCDINLDDYSLEIESVRSRLNSSSKAVILPHMFGCPANIDAFLSLDMPLIEDCAHALGASYRGMPAGSFGKLAVFSYEGSKLVAAGEGGCVSANGPQMLDALQTLRYGLIGSHAYHYRLSDLIAAIALVQLDKLPGMIDKRRRIARIYNSELSRLEQLGFIRRPASFNERASSCYRYVIICAANSSALVSYANECGILIRNPLPSGLLSWSYPHDGADNMNSRILAERGASLPITPDMSDEDIFSVVKLLYTFHDLSE
ncbi:MAG: DegT/DnrJ/EryC1/StrS family aminotransferase [Geobacteraceae bacterium]|nr:DegT/DnrJ/EryC1/StrS family aminotransferase [Geobacteraceae bacterium]